MQKAAVVIGVGRTGNLTPLRSPAPTAERLAEWLHAEGFEVACITDANAPVTGSLVEETIARFVTIPARYHLLVIYFSGHGYWQARTDVWLLSGAPVKPNEAIDLGAAMDMARYSGIKNVVFISDACRSIPDSRSGARVNGRSLFPNYDEIDSISKIDYFKATSEALPAYEGTIEGQPQSLLTHAMVTAFEQPEPQMIREVLDGSQTIRVVPNRRLEDYLQKKVDSLLAALDLNLSQRIEANVPSSEDVYLSRVREPAFAPSPLSKADAFGPSKHAQVAESTATATATESEVRVTDPTREVATLVSRALELGPSDAPPSPSNINNRRIKDRLPDANFDRFETQSGVIVLGARVMAVLALEKQTPHPELLDPGDGASKPAVVRLHGSSPQSIVVAIDGGRCVVLAGLPGYIAHARFHSAGLSNVSYVPSSNTPLWNQYKRVGTRVDWLRALIAVAVEGNTFRVRSSEEAEALANKIRPSQAIDPTLALYAAYAYSQAGNEAHVIHTMQSMRETLGAELFDVRMLSARGTAAREPDISIVPVCPMLTQGWSLIRSRRMSVPGVFESARPYLSGALWTTFEAPGARLIIEAAMQSEGGV